MTGGFVLGEVLILQRGAALQMLAAGLPVAAAVLILFGKSREPKAGFLGSLQISGRSMWLWLLPVFLLAGGFRAWQGQSAFQKEISLNLDGERITVEGRVEKIVPKEEWLVLELGEAAVKKGAGKDSETAPGISGTKGKPENAEGRADDSGVRRLFGL